jgi:ABC-type sugar transport system permease subunit
MASRTASSSRGNVRASLGLVAGLCAVLALPAALMLARKTHVIVLLDVAWAIPVAIVCGVAALLFARGAQGRIRQTLERAGGRSRVRASRWLAVAGISIALSASIAVGFYELLLRLEG